MESHSYSTTSSSSSSYYPVAVHQYREGGTDPQPSSYQSSIHGRVPKPVTKKLPIAPFPRTPPKIYKVEAENFKETVQMLTTAPGFQSNNPRRLHDVAPPPLHLKPRKCSDDYAWSEHQIRSETTLHGGDIPPILSPNFLDDGFSQLWAFSPIKFGPLSPSSLAHWASILPSPRTLSSL